MPEKSIKYYGIKPTAIISDVYPSGKFHYGRAIGGVLLVSAAGSGYVTENTLNAMGLYVENNTLNDSFYVENHILYA